MRENASNIVKRLEENDPTLTFLNLDENVMSNSDINAAIKALENNTTIETLSVHGKNGNKLARAVSEMLKYNRTLKRINLEGNNISDSGASALANVLKRSNTTLKALYLNNNNIGNNGASALIEAANCNKNLSNIDIQSNHKISAENINRLKEILGKDETAFKYAQKKVTLFKSKPSKPKKPPEIIIIHKNPSPESSRFSPPINLEEYQQVLNELKKLKEELPQILNSYLTVEEIHAVKDWYGKEFIDLAEIEANTNLQEYYSELQRCLERLFMAHDVRASRLIDPSLFKADIFSAILKTFGETIAEKIPIAGLGFELISKANTIIAKAKAGQVSENTANLLGTWDKQKYLAQSIARYLTLRYQKQIKRLMTQEEVEDYKRRQSKNSVGEKIKNTLGEWVDMAKEEILSIPQKSPCKEAAGFVASLITLALHDEKIRPPEEVDISIEEQIALYILKPQGIIDGITNHILSALGTLTVLTKDEQEWNLLKMYQTPRNYCKKTLQLAHEKKPDNIDIELIDMNNSREDKDIDSDSSDKNLIIVNQKNDELSLNKQEIVQALKAYIEKTKPKKSPILFFISRSEQSLKFLEDKIALAERIINDIERTEDLNEIKIILEGGIAADAMLCLKERTAPNTLTTTLSQFLNDVVQKNLKLPSDDNIIISRDRSYSS